MSDEYYYRKQRSPENLKFFDKEMLDAFGKFDFLVMKEGRLPKKVKELIAVACAYNARCPWCIEGHTKAALRESATKEEIADAIAIAAALSAGAAMAHRGFALDVEKPESK